MKRILIALTSMALVLPAIAADPQVSYPAGYRNWHHVKSMVVDKGHPLHEAFGGIHHLYANKKAEQRQVRFGLARARGDGR